MKIRWDTLDPRLYEDLVSVLLSNMHPDIAQRIDGSGGDGGRDVQLVYPDGVDGFELKSFTGRLKGPKREQVKRSIRRARELSLRSWTLIVPIDPTPKELEWFNGLSDMLPCPMHWVGKTWLEAQLAERPYVANFFLRGAAEEAMELLRELGKEEAALANGVPDAAARAAAIARRANDIDPHYRFRIESDGDETRITVIPRYPGADRDRPINVQTVFKFPTDTDEGQEAYADFEEHMKFGTPVRVSGEYIERVAIDAPAGLGGEWSGGTIEMSSVPPPDRDRRLFLAASDAHGGYAAQVEMALKIAHRGRGGAILEGTDRSGSLKARLRMDAENHRAQVTLTILGDQPFVPHDMLPLARLLEHIREHDELALVTEAGVEIGSVQGGFGSADEWASEGFASLVEDLVLIQTKAGRIETVQPEITMDDAIMIRAGASWARGEAVRGTWSDVSVTLNDHVPEETRHRMLSQESALRLVSPGPATVLIQGVPYRFGAATVHHYLAGRLSDLCRRRYSRRLPPGGARVTFVPGHTDAVETLVSFTPVS